MPSVNVDKSVIDDVLGRKAVCQKCSGNYEITNEIIESHCCPLCGWDYDDASWTDACENIMGKLKICAEFGGHVTIDSDSCRSLLQLLKIMTQELDGGDESQ